ncbi:MAG: hypothetical protein MMC33_004891 [Icmadophila ericetorum]|nr:hypothetical protein [Icmadophila ericetorum]
MAASPPTSPGNGPQRPMSAFFNPRSTSRMSMSSKHGGGSRASDEESKTSVKVAIRVRPPLKPTDPGFELTPQRFQRSMVQVTSPTSLVVDAPQGKKLFVFDKVFGEEVNQEGVWEYVSGSVDAFVQGYNVSVMAYGQSGAGKSFTMGTSGAAEQSDRNLMGVIPRAAGALFEKLSGPPSLTRGSSGIRTPTRYSTNSIHTLQSISKAGTEKNWQLRATYVEIYNEQLRDLLLSENIPHGDRGAVMIREDAKGRILLTGLNQVTINSMDDLLAALNFGSTIRQTDSTAINAKSSRSHAVFSLNLVQRKNKGPTAQEKRFSMPLDSAPPENWVTIDSKLHFVDLAGSERLKNTGASGERAKEGISINAGLASLGKVISQLSSRQSGSHVSYRDSKVTRLLQDSIGGNAITYMIACVTPAEFHLSETLNTVQYAQRARAIQSKPKIQLTSDEADKQALIDRLRAEISFLREQIRNTERGDRNGGSAQEIKERQNEREIELQNHLLDIQENYSALSQRHAKLISEISKARDTDSESGETPILNGAIGNSAVERLKRSNSFAEAAEQVVLEYEKTIQSLETSLSNTRSSLATTESSLLERETKCAYVETFNQQLQARIRKLVDRESSTEQYLHDLETRLDGQNSGDEKNSAIVIELRKEMSRMRDNEASCEEYISNLEEKLAEADQDMELMQREINRLEHVVERQLSLGKLDSLLYEFDRLQSNGNAPNDIPMTNGHSKARILTNDSGFAPELSLKEAIQTPIPESDEEDWEHLQQETPKASKIQAEPNTEAISQSTVVSDKLDVVTKELIDLRIEHEATVNGYDLLSAKYEEALQTLADLQDAIDESRRPTSISSIGSFRMGGHPSFLADARVKGLKIGGQSSSPSLSSELSLAGQLPTPTDSNGTEEFEGANNSRDVTEVSREDPSLVLSEELLNERRSANEQEMHTLHEKYVQLQEQHLGTLDLVEELKAEVQKAKMNSPTSGTAPVIRRKSSQNVMTSIDRAHRSLASLSNMAAENLSDKPDTLQAFDLNLNTAMHELHQRSERIQSLEAELSSVKKEMESKMMLISGLARERTSMKTSSPMDISVVSSMQDQILRSQNEIKMLHETYATKEQELMSTITSLRETLASHPRDLDSVTPDTSARSSVMDGQHLSKGSSEKPDSVEQSSKLQKELVRLESKHQTALDSMQASEKKLLATIAQLEASLATAQNSHSEKSAEYDAQAANMAASVAGFERERGMHAETVKSLSRDVDNHKVVIKSNEETIKSLEDSYANAQRELGEARRFRQQTQEQLDHHRTQISWLEQKVEEHQSDVEFHKHDLKSLHKSHSRELDEARSSALLQAAADAEARFTEVSASHEAAINQLNEASEARKKELQAHITELESALASHKQDLAERGSVIDHLKQEQERIGAAKAGASEDLIGMKAKLAAAEGAKFNADTSLSKAQAAIDELTQAKQKLTMELEDVREKEQRASRLVEELEGQLNSTFEDTRITSGRLSTLQSTHDTELSEARAAAIKAQEEVEMLTRRLESSERGSTILQMDGSNDGTTAGLRKSASVVSLPSPPPAIPLPPLPTNGNSANSPPSTSYATRDIQGGYGNRDPQAALIAEEQEARIRTIEKHLYAEKQLTATLEDALVDLETSSNKFKADMEGWKQKARSYEEELANLTKERNSNRMSLQAVEEERSARREAEAARAHLEERMAAINKKKKKSGFNCF